MSSNNDVLVCEKMTGSVISYYPEKGYGFIRSDSTEVKDDIFVYFNQIVPSKEKNIDTEFLKLQQHQRVEFALYSSSRGLLAKNVVRQEMSSNILADVTAAKLEDENLFKPVKE
jgi:cold shock CspA family protein